MFKKNKIDTLRAIELEIWLLENYQKYESEQFNDENFTAEENIYLQEAYRVPLWEIKESLLTYYSNKSQDNRDSIRFIDNLCKQYKVDSHTIIKRIRYFKLIHTYLDKHQDIIFPKVNTHNELVRDNYIDSISVNGANAIYHTLEDKQYEIELNKKLYQGYLKLVSSKTPEEKNEALAEMLEIIELIANINDKCLPELFDEIESKKEKLGGYTKKLYLSRTWKKK